jgi:protein archease
VSWAVVEHTADVGIEVRAASLGELFADAAAGFVDTIVPVTQVQPDVERELSVEATALDLLLVAWLDELLYVFDTEGLLLPAGVVEVIAADGACTLTARMRGERWDPARHPQKVQVKAITYHGLEVAHRDNGWFARVIFDI